MATGGDGWTRAAAGDDLASVPNPDDSGAGPQKESALQTKLFVWIKRLVLECSHAISNYDFKYKR